MAIPSAIKINKNGVQYINQVDRTKYLLKELVHAANKDVGKFVTREAKKSIEKNYKPLYNHIQKNLNKSFS